MAADHRCPQCGSELWCDLSPQGLCPKCLLSLGLNDPDREIDEDLSDLIDDPPPLSIGPYRVLRLLGEGGMGLVYLAEQNRPLRRRVAVKIIKLGMDTKRVISRFRSERQALAQMSHPHIAKVFDAGSTDQGRPYFVMEFVAGIPITEYCDKHRLSIRERLLLFQQVCEAIQHAHNRGIIHRDIKPSNVLVEQLDGNPTSKVIDFGVAKATSQRQTEKTFFTEHGVLIGTPEYMSPEQTNPGDQDVDLRTDVYSLGVLLYELMAGAPPFDSSRLRRAGFDEMLTMIREEEPAILTDRLGSLGETTWEIALSRGTDYSTLWRQLKGELDWIARKAISKVPSKRYSSASELASEIQKYLRSEPVSARPEKSTALSERYLETHRLAIGGSLAVLILLIVIFFAGPDLFLETGRQLFPSNTTEPVSRTSQPDPQLAEADVRVIEPVEPLSNRSALPPKVAVPRPTLTATEVNFLLRNARTLSPEEVFTLENNVLRNPFDESSRTKLLGYYMSKTRENSAASQVRRNHLLWMIRNAPESAVLGVPEGTSHGDIQSYADGKRAWIEQIKNQPRNLRILEHSAQYFLIHDRELAEQSLLTARQLDKSNPRWPQNLGHLYSLGMNRDRSRAPDALREFEVAYRLSDGKAQDALLHYLARAAWVAGEHLKARDYAAKMLKSSWPDGLHSHHGTIVLGLISLVNNNVEEAKMRLIEAGKTKGYPTLNSFGPDMTLAKQLLERGEQAAVLEYFELCSKFWRSDRGRLDEWAVDVEQGRMPNFRNNLKYD